MCDAMTWSCQPTLQFVELICGAVRIVGAGGRLMVEYPPVNNVLLGHRSCHIYLVELRHLNVKISAGTDMQTIFWASCTKVFCENA